MKKILFSLFAVLLFNIISAQDKSPKWTKDLIIYEISTKNFNSPNEPETGTFKSVAKKMHYLKKLGINAIWLAGTNWADSHHFYNIWTQYACMRPDSIDSTLGTREDMRIMLKTAHRHGIKVFMDVITHGVMNNSPLIKEHPEWFKGGSWGMTDYDWKGQHPDLDRWWVKTFTDYCLKDGFDGFRLDVNFYRADLWHKIRQNCLDAGKEIVLIQENFLHADNALDLYQNSNRISISNSSPTLEKRKVTDPGSYYLEHQKYFSEEWNNKLPEGYSPDHFYMSIELSNHDTGWRWYPTNLNPYVAKGSRALFGYCVLLTPSIPKFMSGEEFNASYVPVPWHSAALYGDSGKNDGRWLYGSWIQWNQLKNKERKSMLNDVTRMISIRKRYSDVIHAYSITKDSSQGIISIKPTEGDVNNPYILYQKGKKAVLVAGNTKDVPVSVKVNIPVKEMGFESNCELFIKDVWSKNGKAVKLADDGSFSFTIGPDRTSMGGLAVFVIE